MKQKITYLYVFLFTILTFQTASAQQILDKKINLPKGELTGLKIVTAVKEQSGARFNYGEAINAKLTAPIKTKATTITVQDALELIKSTYGLSYEINNVYITLSLSKSPNALAGGSPGTLKGRIVEFETSQPLPGASVYIVGLKKGITSDNSGYYKFTGIPEGQYTLQVSYVSFTTEKVKVEVKAGKEETYDVKMRGTNSLNEVVVSGVRKSIAPVAHTTDREVLEEIKASSLVVSAISSEQISKSADRNAAEVVRRVSGVTTVDDKFIIVRGLNQRYNLTYLNDNVAPSTEVNSRAFALDLIPSRIIDKILIFKSPGPENQADATGGVVKIYTKDAKNVKHFDIELQTGIRPGTSFNKNFLAYKGGKFDFLGFDDGSRKLPSAVPGYGSLKLANLTPSQYASSFSPVLNYGSETALPNLQLTANYYNSFNVFGKRLSMLSSLSYKNESLKSDVFRQQGINEANASSTDKISNEDRNTETAQLNLLQNFTLSLRDSSTISFKNFILQQGQSNTIVRISQPTYDPNMFSNDKDIILSYNQRFLYAGNLGGSHYSKNGKQHLQWNAGYTYSSQESPDQRVIRLVGTTESSAIGDPKLQWRARGANPLDNDDANAAIPMALGLISRVWSRSSEGVYNASLDETYKLKPWLTLKAGTFQQWKKRELGRRIYTVHEGDLTDPSENHYTPGVNGYVDPSLVRFREQDLQNVWSSEYFRDDHAGLQVFDRTTGSDTYVGTEQNNSAYLALNITPFNRKVEIYGGFRYEYNRQKIGAAIPPSIYANAYNINTPILIDNPTNSWLPSINISWRPTESWVLRGAYGKTVNRTEFREVSPFRELDFENNSILYGNPTLKSAKVDNYDTRLEFYPRKNSKGEVVSIGAFYKELQNPIERINTSSRVESAFPEISYQNAASATIKGLEVELRKSLDFVPLKFFRDLSLIANVTLIKSEALNDTTILISQRLTGDKRPLQGQAPYIINTGLYYDNAGLGTKVSLIYNVSGTNIYAAGRGFSINTFVTGPAYRGSLLELPRDLLDLSVTQRLYKSVQLKLGVQNILNKAVVLAEDYNFTNKYEPVKDIPNDGSIGAKVRDGDNISSSYNPGRYFTFTLSYSL